MEECRRLFEHFRNHPDDARANPRELETRLGVPATLIQQFQEALPDLAKRSAKLTPQLQQRGRSGFWGAPILRDWTSFLILTSVLLVIVDLIANAMRNVQNAIADFMRPGVVVVILLILAGQALCVYWHGMVRRAASSALICSAIVSLTSATSFRDGFRIEMPSVIAFLVFFVAYTVVFVPVATLGAYANMNRELALRTLLSRQELLDRLLEVRDTLRGMSNRQEPTALRTTRRWLDIMRARIYPVSFAMAIVLALSFVLPMSILDPKGVMLSPQTVGENISPGIMVFMLALLGVGFAAQVWLGFMAGGPIRALKAMIFYAAGSFLVYLLPIGSYGLQKQIEHFSVAQWLGSYGMIFLSGVVGGVGALVERSSARRRLILSNDPVALHAEMLDLEWRLRPQSRRVCVMVVDAERSSLMKSESDPLEAEWTFREYQKYLARISESFMGTVHSTAGDGAVIGFPAAGQAYLAARQIQHDLADFNQRVNRLKRPFRLRIGLHAGQVEGDLDKVQFTAVIDIAAHVEKVCKAGEIAMTEPVAAELAQVPVHEIAQNVDGFVVFGTGRPANPAIAFQV